MKILNKIYSIMVGWAEVLYEYRKHTHNKSYY